MFLKSDTSKVVMSAIPIPGNGNPLSIDDMELVKRIMTELCGSERVLVQGQAFPSIGDAKAQPRRDGQARARSTRSRAWKVYTHAGGRPWWLDDHEADAPQVGEASSTKRRAVGPKIVCVHKGFGRRRHREYASPGRHRARPRSQPRRRRSSSTTRATSRGGDEGPYTDATADLGVNRLITSAEEAPASARAATSTPSSAPRGGALMRDPTQAAHVLGKLLERSAPTMSSGAPTRSGTAHPRTRSRRSVPSRSHPSSRSSTATRR